ncbi:MAG: FGGY family carbohydrate kinase [Acidimicrobiia bacterium]
MSILVIDVGTSSVRAAVVRPGGRLDGLQRRASLPDTPFPGLVEFDATALAAIALEAAAAALEAAGPVDAVGVTNQRASTIVWDRATGEPVRPAIGWQDLRTVGECLVHQAAGLRLAPNVSATKLALLLQGAGEGRDLCFGTVDTWLVWQLTGGRLHVTDPSNAGLTGLLRLDGSGWDLDVCAALGIPPEVLPAIVDSTGGVGDASALAGGPTIAGIAGDQQASLVGQSCVRPGSAKATFGTGGMLDVCTGAARPSFPTRGEAGSFPIVAWRDGGTVTWGVESVMLSAGSAVEWLRDDLGLVGDAADTAAIAAACPDTGGVVFVPALVGLGAPHWDHGARGALLGLTRGSGRPQVVRAVLEGVAHRGADLLEAAEADAAVTVDRLRVDGGMSANPVFLQALADAIGRPVEVAPHADATLLGAAYLAGMAVGTWAGWDDIATAWAPRAVVEPAGAADRDRWRDAVARAGGWYPELSAIDF